MSASTEHTTAIKMRHVSIYMEDFPVRATMVGRAMVLLVQVK